MTWISIRRFTILTTALAICLGAGGCGGNDLYEAPQAEYVAPPDPGAMKPASKQKQRPQFGVPL